MIQLSFFCLHEDGPMGVAHTRVSDGVTEPAEERELKLGEWRAPAPYRRRRHGGYLLSFLTLDRT